MVDSVEVRLGAEASGLKSNMADAATAAQSSLKTIAESLKGVIFGSKSADDAVRESMHGIKQSFSGMAEGAKSASGTVVSSFALLALGIAASAAVIGGALILALKGIDDLKEEATAVNQLRNVFGMTSDEAARTNVALKLIGKTSEEYSGIALHLAKSIKADEERVQALGVATRDAVGHLLPLDQIQKNAIGTMQQYRAGVDQDMVALELWGRSAKDVYGFLALTDPIMERAAQLQRELGIEMGPEKRAAIKAYQVEVRALGIVWGEIRQALGEALMPVLKALAAWFATTGVAAIKAFAQEMSAFADEWTLLVAHIEAGTVKTANAFANMVVRAQETALVMKYAIAGQWADIPKVVAAANLRVATNSEATANRVVAIWDAAGKKMETKATPAATDDRPTGGGRGYVAKAPAATSRVSEWEAMLKAERDAYERMKLDQGSFERWSEEQTSSFWEKIKATYKLSTQELQSVDGKWYDAQRTIRQQGFESLIAGLEREKAAIRFNYDERIRLATEQARLIAQAYGASSKEAIAAETRVTQEYERQAEQRMRLVDIERKQADARADHEAAMEQTALTQKVALQQMSVEQALAGERSLQERLYAIKSKALQDEIALEAQGPNDPLKIATLNAQLETLELNHQQKLTDIQNKAILDRQQYVLQANDAIRSSTSTLLTDLQKGAKGLKQSFLDYFNSIAQTLQKLAADTIVKKFLGAGTTGGDWLSKLTGMVGGTADGSAAALTTAGVGLTKSSGLLDAAAAALQAAAAAMSAGGGGGGGLGGLFGGGGGSGQGQGYGTIGSNIPDGPYPYAMGTPYVPSDQLGFLHKGEAVVPANMNKRGGNSMSVQQHFHINGPVSSATQAQIMGAAAMGAARVNHRDH